MQVHISIEASRQALQRLETLASANAEADPYLADEIQGGKDFLREHGYLLAESDDPEVLSEQFGITFGPDEFETNSPTIH